MEWAAWGPTIATIIAYVFFAGVLWSRQRTHDIRIQEHDKQLNDHTKDLTDHSVKIGKLEAWNAGYAAARAVYERCDLKPSYS
jgi:hypothetical protein